MKLNSKYQQVRFKPLFIIWLWVLFALFLSKTSVHANENPDEIEVRLSRQTNTLYNIFNQITRQTGYFFIYDSEIVDSDKEIRIGRTHKSLTELLHELVPDSSLEFDIIENHILIHRPVEEKVEEEPLDEQQKSYVILRGRIFDGSTAEPLPYSTISHAKSARGVIANENGIFKLRLDYKHIEDSLTFSSLGYKACNLPVSLLKKGFADIAMEFEPIFLEELTISYFDPLNVLEKALSKKKDNYPNEPSNHISFYREGIFVEEEVMYYSESVISEYRPSYESYQQDQMKLLQSRSIKNLDSKDTLIFKLKAGLGGASQMDVIKNVPDFIDSRLMRNYNFLPAGMVKVDNRYAYAIDFEAKRMVREAIHKGTIYIDKESYGIVSVDFEINRDYIRDIQSRFIPRPSPNYIVNMQSAEYIVSYKLHDDKYHLNHVKGEIKLRVRPRNRLLRKTYWIFFEKATVQINTEDVQRFRRRETIRKNVILAEENLSYDYEFWGDYNIIVPEKEISESLSRITGKIESLDLE